MINYLDLCIYLVIKHRGELQRQMHKASRRVLDSQLNQLINYATLTKITCDKLSLKAKYELTFKGKTVISAIKFTAKWREDYRHELEN